jgi:hypothetical protein
MVEIEILTNLELSRLEYYANQQYGAPKAHVNAVCETNPINGETTIKLGNISDSTECITTISHEEIHSVLDNILCKRISHALDTWLYSAKYLECGEFKGCFADNHRILKEFFTIDNLELI